MSASPIFPGAIRQNGYIVADLQAAMEAWLAIGVGPWIVLGASVQTMTYRGTVVSPELTIAFANSGDLQIELIHQLNDEPSIYKEFRDSGKVGYHHIAYWADDYEAFDAAARAAGMSFVNEGDGGGMARFCYVELDGITSTCVEVMELNAMTGWMMGHVREAHDTWDGMTDPIRSLM